MPLLDKPLMAAQPAKGWQKNLLIPLRHDARESSNAGGPGRATPRRHTKGGRGYLPVLMVVFFPAVVQPLIHPQDCADKFRHGYKRPAPILFSPVTLKVRNGFCCSGLLVPLVFSLRSKWMTLVALLWRYARHRDRAAHG